MKKWLVFIVFVLCLTGCSTNNDVIREKQPKTDPNFIFMSNSDIKGQVDIYTVKDRKTGFEYLLYDGNARGEMTPRINKDGSLFTREANSYSNEKEFVLVSITEIQGSTEIYLIRDLVTDVEYLIYDGASKGSIYPRIQIENDTPTHYSY